MPQPLNVEEHWIKTYSDNVQLVAQQMVTKIRGAVMEEPMEGEVHFFDSYGQAEMVELTSRHQETPHTPVPHARRQVSAKPFVFAEFIDPADARRILTDPTRRYTQVAAAGANRKIDKLLMDAFEASVYTGREGTGTLATFDTTNMVVAGGTAGLTVLKLNEAARRLDEMEVEDEDRFIFVPATGMESLRNEEKATSADYNTVRALVNGEIDTFLGFTFIKAASKRFPKVTTMRHAYFWQKKGMALAIAQEPTARVDQLPERNYATQVYLSLDMGAVRLEEARVGRLEIYETP